MRTLLFDMRCGNDLRGEMEPFAEVIKSFGSKGVVIPLPGELGLEITTGGKGLARFDHLRDSALAVKIRDRADA